MQVSSIRVLGNPKFVAVRGFYMLDLGVVAHVPPDIPADQISRNRPQFAKSEDRRIIGDCVFITFHNLRDLPINLHTAS